jgi:topoisomerase IA-like protein
LEKEDQYMFTGSIKVLNEFINNLVEKYKKEGTNIEDSLNDPTQFKLVIGGGRRRTSKKRTTKRHATKRHATKRRTTKKRTTRKRGGKDVKPLRFH